MTSSVTGIKNENKNVSQHDNLNGLDRDQCPK